MSSNISLCLTFDVLTQCELPTLITTVSTEYILFYTKGCVPPFDKSCCCVDRDQNGYWKGKKMLDVISRHPIEQLQLENNLPETKFKTPHSASL